MQWQIYYRRVQQSFAEDSPHVTHHSYSSDNKKAELPAHFQSDCRVFRRRRKIVEFTTFEEWRHYFCFYCTKGREHDGTSAETTRIELTSSVCRHSKLSLEPETEQWTHNIFFTCQTLFRLVLHTCVILLAANYVTLRPGCGVNSKCVR